MPTTDDTLTPETDGLESEVTPPTAEETLSADEPIDEQEDAERPSDSPEPSEQDVMAQEMEEVRFTPTKIRKQVG